jgi:hypothetical protein
MTWLPRVIGSNMGFALTISGGTLESEAFYAGSLAVLYYFGEARSPAPEDPPGLVVGVPGRSRACPVDRRAESVLENTLEHALEHTFQATPG